MRLNQRNPVARKVFEDEYAEGRERQGRWKEEHKLTGMSEDELGRQEGQGERGSRYTTIDRGA